FPAASGSLLRPRSSRAGASRPPVAKPPAPTRGRRAAGRRRALKPGAYILLGGSVERRLRALHVAQARPLRGGPGGAHRGRRAAEAGVGEREKRDHVVLVDAVARDADRSDERARAVHRQAAGKDLDAVHGLGEPAAAGRGAPADSREELALDEVELEADVERA